MEQRRVGQPDDAVLVGKPADRPQELLPLGEILYHGEAGDDSPLAILQWGGRQRQEERRAGAGGRVRTIEGPVVPGERATQGLHHLGRPQGTQIHAAERLARHARDRREALVALRDPEGVVVQEHAGRRLVVQSTVTRFAEVALGHGRAPFALHQSVAHLALDGRHEAPQVILQDVVGGARPHGSYGHVLADGPRHDDRRQVGVELVDHRQSVQGAEARQHVVEQRHVPAALGERFAERRLGLHAAPLDLEPAAPQLAEQELRVVGRVFNAQDGDAHRPCLRAPPRAASR